MTIKNYFSQNIRKRVPSKLQRKKKQLPNKVGYTPNTKNQVSLDDAIRNEARRKEVNSLKYKLRQKYNNRRNRRN